MNKGLIKKKILFFILAIFCLCFGYLITPRKITDYGDNPPACILYPVEVYEAKLYTLVKDMKEEKVKWKVYFWPNHPLNLPICMDDALP